MTTGDGRAGSPIDVGGLCVAPQIHGLAVACADAMAGHPDPVRAALPLVTGYHEMFPLAQSELELLLDLIRTRLEWAGDEWAGDEWVWFRLRDACGHEPDPGAGAVRQFLGNVEVFPVLGRPLAGIPRLTFDWSTGTGADAWTPQRLSARLAEVGAEVGIGRYLEDRDVYTTDAYATCSGSGNGGPFTSGLTCSFLQGPRSTPRWTASCTR